VGAVGARGAGNGEPDAERATERALLTQRQGACRGHRAVGGRLWSLGLVGTAPTVRQRRINGPVDSRQPGLLKRKDRLAEDSAVRDDLSAGNWVPKLPGLVVGGVPDHDALDSVRCQRWVLILL
jgi:hypothetical protein